MQIKSSLILVYGFVNGNYQAVDTLRFNDSFTAKCKICN